MSTADLPERLSISDDPPPREVRTLDINTGEDAFACLFLRPILIKNTKKNVFEIQFTFNSFIREYAIIKPKEGYLSVASKVLNSGPLNLLPLFVNFSLHFPSSSTIHSPA